MASLSFFSTNNLLKTHIVKKIKLRATQSDSKIFREVNALSRLNHRFIVRYYTTWVESAEPSSVAGSGADSDSGTSVPQSREPSWSGDSDPFQFDLDDLGGSGSRHSFPSIRFTRSGSPESTSSDDPESDEAFDDDPFMPVELRLKRRSATPSQPPPISRTLYIQMVYLTTFMSGTFVFLTFLLVGIRRTSNAEGGKYNLYHFWFCR